MNYDFLGIVVFGFVLFIGLVVVLAFIVLAALLIKATIRYIKSGDARKEKRGIQKSLGEVLKHHREKCKMTLYTLT